MRPSNRNRPRRHNNNHAILDETNSTEGWTYGYADPRYFTEPRVVLDTRMSAHPTQEELEHASRRVGTSVKRAGCIRITNEYLCMLIGVNITNLRNIYIDQSTGCIKVIHDDENLPGVYDIPEGAVIPETRLPDRHVKENLVNLLERVGYIIESPYHEEEVDDATSDGGEA